MALTRRRATHLVVALTLASTTLLVGGCGTSGSNAGGTSGTTSTSGSASGDAVTKSDLESASFESTKVTGHDLVAGSAVTITFDGAAMAVKGGCNTMTGAWSVDGGTLKWTGQPAMTMMACDEPLMQQDTWLTGLFTTGMTGTKSGNTLTLTSGDTTMELTKKG